MFGIDTYVLSNELRSGWSDLVRALSPDNLTPGAKRSESEFDWRSMLQAPSTLSTARPRPAFDPRSMKLKPQAPPTAQQWPNWRSMTKTSQAPPATDPWPNWHSMTKPVIGAPPPSPEAAQARASGNVQQILQSLATANDVPLRLVRAIMMAESGGNPAAAGDNGASIGLFQLHERGMGSGMTKEQRADPYTNAFKAIPIIAAARRSALESGLRGEDLVRATYDRAINPGGGWGYQGNSVVDWYRRGE